MKKTLIFAAIAGTALSASAQIGKGSFFAGLDFSYYSNNGKNSSTSNSTTTQGSENKYSYLTLGPSIQYFLAENLSVGLSAGINNNKQTNDYPNNANKDKYEYNTNGTTFGLFARKYINCADNFYTFVGLGFDMGSSKGTNSHSTTVNNAVTTTKTSSEYKNSNVGLNLGFAWFITPKIMFQGSFGALSYSSNKQKYNISEDGKTYQEQNSSGINFSLTSGNYPFSLGFAYRLAGGE